jgi:uncharacterized protein (TIGR03083 family)
VQHLGEVHRFWAAAVNAGPAAAPPAESASEGVETAPREREPLLAWSAASTQQLLDALREAGPNRGCWTWWGTSESPQTSGAVARHQLQEVTVHTYDAQPATAADEGPDVAFASARGTAAELVLALYGRIPIDSLQLDGDRRLFDLLRDWDPDE